MRLVYLPATRRDLIWFRHYYERVFPEGAARARERVRAIEAALLDNPWIGRPTHRPEVRRMAIPRTPFVLLYRVRDERIEILRLIDGRAFEAPPE